jgi:hypothetical protein
MPEAQCAAAGGQFGQRFGVVHAFEMGFEFFDLGQHGLGKQIIEDGRAFLTSLLKNG